jgi:putative ABC transport system permease protein
MLAELAWRNIWRQPYRAALSLVSIAAASTITVFLLALQQGGYGTMEESVLRLVDGFAQVQPPGYVADPDLRKAIDDPAALIADLESVPGVAAAAPRAETYGILSNGSRSYGSGVVGVSAAEERKVTSLAATIVEGRYLESHDTDAVVVGSRLARNLKVGVGDKLTLLGAAADGSVAADILTVRGIFDTGAPEIDRQLIEIPLARFQSDFGMEGRVNVVALGGHKLSQIQSALPALRAVAGQHGLVVRSWTEIEPAFHDVILLDASFSLLLYASLVVIVVFIILNTLLMSVLERTREFGMLLAVGMRPNQIGRMIWLELLFLAGTGSLFGIAVGSAITAEIESHGGIPFSGAEALFAQWHMPSTLYPQLSLTSALAGPLAIAFAIAVAGLVPYSRVRRLEPVSAMRAA